MANSKDDTRGAWEPPKIFRDVRFLYALAAITFFLPFLLTRGGSKWLDFTDTGQIGDTIGGIMGPMVGLIGAILTYMAFYEQYRANQEQMKSNIEIREREFLNGFDARFFQHIKLADGIIEKFSVRQDIVGVASLKYWNWEFVSFFGLIISLLRNDEIAPRLSGAKEQEFAMDVTMTLYSEGFLGLNRSFAFYEKDMPRATIVWLIKEIELVFEVINEKSKDLIFDRLAHSNNSYEIVIDKGFLRGKKIQAHHLYFQSPQQNLVSLLRVIESVVSLINGSHLNGTDRHFYEMALRASLNSDFLEIWRFYTTRKRNRDGMDLIKSGFLYSK